MSKLSWLSDFVQNNFIVAPNFIVSPGIEMLCKVRIDLFLTLIHMGFYRATIYGGGVLSTPPPSENYLRFLGIQYNLAQLQLKSFLACRAIRAWLAY